MSIVVAGGLATKMHASGPRADDVIDPQAQVLLDRARSVLLGAETIAVHISHVDVMASPGLKMEMESTVDLAAQRPQKIDISVTMGKSQNRLVSDGEHLFAFTRDRYTQKPAPPRIQDVNEELIIDVYFMPSHTSIILSMLFADRFPDEFAELAGLSVVGDEEIDGLPVTRLRLTLEPKADPHADERAPKVEPFVLNPSFSKMVLDVWIDRGERPLIRKLYSDLTPFLQGRAKPADGSTLEVTSNFSAWKIDEPIVPERFTFTPPEGSREVVLLVSPGSEWPTVGNPPAEMDLPLLDGGRFNPADHKGQVMVMVYWRRDHADELFWISDVVKTAAEFADQGVQLYTINIGDSEESIRAFLKEHDWNAPVALGDHETVPQSIAVSRVPYVLIVGQDGIVQGMHYQAMRNTSKRLEAQLRWLLRGKSLLEE